MTTNPVTVRWDSVSGGAVIDGDDVRGEIRRLDIRALSVTLDATPEVRARLPEWFGPRSIAEWQRPSAPTPVRVAIAFLPGRAPDFLAFEARDPEARRTP